MKLDSTPLVTVLMPCFNAEKYLNTAIKSIIHQTYKNLHILLINDGSTDSTLDICKRWSQKDNRIQLIENDKNLGLIKTLNKGISFAKGIYIARMDADDISDLNRIKKQTDFLESNSDIGIVGSTSLPIDLEGNVINGNPLPAYLHPETLAFSCFFSQPFTHGSILAKTHLLQANLYSNAFIHSEDFELWLRLSNRGNKFANIDEVLYFYRINPDGVSIKNEAIQKKSHNKASQFYLELALNSKVENDIIGILNNRPIMSVNFNRFKLSISVFKNFFNSYPANQELLEYFVHQRIDICIQAFKYSENLKSKLGVSAYFFIYCLNLTSIKYLISKFSLIRNKLKLN